jgi:hypothetical protein
MKPTSRSLSGRIAIGLAVPLALLASSAQASPRTGSLVRPVKTVGGSVHLTLNPSPACGDFTSPGQCDFESRGRVKVSSASECRGRDVKISRVDAGALVTTPGTNRRGVAPTSIGGRYTAFYPGVAFNNPVYEVTGGTKMTFRAVAPRFKSAVANNPLRPVVCKRLKSSIEVVTAPMPPPPDS